MHVREVEHRPHPAEPARDLDHVVEPSRARARGPSPRSRTARRGPSPRAARAARRAARTTESIASSRVRPSRKPGWKTTTSAPAAFAIPAEWSSIPTAMFSFLPRSACPMKPAIGACTESAMSARARELAEALGELVVHPEARPRSRSRTPRSRARGAPRSPPRGSPAPAPAPDRSGGCRAIGAKPSADPSPSGIPSDPLSTLDA